MKFIIAEIVLIAALVVSLLSGNGTGAVLAGTLVISLGVVKYYLAKYPSKTPDEYLQEARKRHGLVG